VQLHWPGSKDVTLSGTVPVSRDQLANDFSLAGERFPLIDRGRGIRKPLGWRAALSIITSVPKSGRGRPYDDVGGPDGLHRPAHGALFPVHRCLNCCCLVPQRAERHGLMDKPKLCPQISARGLSRGPHTVGSKFVYRDGPARCSEHPTGP
jgi:hypothetical protein